MPPFPSFYLNFYTIDLIWSSPPLLTGKSVRWMPIDRAVCINVDDSVLIMPKETIIKLPCDGAHAIEIQGE